MAIQYKTGDLLAEPAEALVNTVNCVGFMGRGIALQFKRAWPDNFRAYAAACKRNAVQPGRMFVFETGLLDNPRYIINFPTKRHWRAKSKLEDVELGLAALTEEIRRRGIRSVAVPPLGAGLGGLVWEDVRGRIEHALGALEGVDVVVFEPRGAPLAGAGRKAKVVPRMTEGRAALLGLMDRYLRGLLDPFVSLLEVHKLMYFMQESGARLKLRVAKGPYGPYAENLRHVLSEIEGHFVTGYGAGGDDPDKLLELADGVIERAHRVLAKRSTMRHHFDRVATLVDGFESPTGLELLATVHWVVTRERAQTLDEVVTLTHGWGPRKRRFLQEEIALAHRVLTERGWLGPA